MSRHLAAMLPIPLLIPLVVLLAALLPLAACEAPPPPTPQARADAATLAACREHADAVYDRTRRDAIYTINNSNTPYSANDAYSMVDRGLPQRYGYETMTRDCVRNTGAATGRPDTVAPEAAKPEPEVAATVASLSAIRGVFAQRNARIFYAGSVTCWTGSWMQRVATDWLAWELTHSVLWVSVIAFCNLAPSVVISPLAGAVADRIDRVRLTVASQFVAAGQAAILVALILTGLIRVEFIAALSAFNGMAETFAQPARQCLLPGLVPRAFLPGAVALNSLTYNIARFIGPALSGLMIAAWGVVPPIACNCAAFLFASLTMYLLRLDPAIRLGHRSAHSIFYDAAEGIRYVARHRGIGPIMLFAAAVGMLLRSVPEMLPPYVADLFGSDARGLATLASTMGCAALVGGTLVAIRGRLGGLTRIAVTAGLVMALATAGFVATRHFAVGVVCVAVMGAATTMHGISIQTLLQNSASAAMVGRVLSLWGMITRAAPAMGALVYGVSAEFLGLQLPVLIGCLLCALAWLRAKSRLSRMSPALEGSETLA